MHLTDARRRARVDRLPQAKPEGGDRRQRQRVQQARLHRHHQRHLIGQPQRRMLRLVQDGPDAGTAGELLLHPFVRHATETGERFKLQELRVVEPHALCRVPQRNCLRLPADPAHAGPHVHGRLLPLIEQLGVQHDLPVGDGDEVGGNIGAQIARIRLGDRQRGQRACALFFGQLGRALQQPRMHVEHVPRVGLPPRRLPGEQRYFPVGGGVFGQVVEHDQRVSAAVAKILCHRHRREGCNPLQAR